MFKKSVLAIFVLLVLSSCSLVDKISHLTKRNNTVKVYFTKANDELGVVLISVDRKVPKDSSPYETALKELFKGPNAEEKNNMELNTEIPVGTRLIKISESKKEVQVNISSQFMVGGGAETMQARFRQLRETVLSLAKGRPVYLLIDGQRVNAIGGEGLEVNQPLN